jgi:cathepsin L
MPSFSKILAVGAALLILPSEALKAHSTTFMKSQVNLNTYTFEQYCQNYGREYKVGTAEYRHRAALFAQSVQEIHAKNAQNTREGRAWKAGVHPFMDWSASERTVLNAGYKPSSKRAGGRGLALLNTESRTARSASTMNMTLAASSFSSATNPAVRNQGNCGSCWAISAASCLEAHLQRQGTPESVRVSAQALVDCVPNPQHCGGDGGCQGATGELAYAYVRDVGIPLEADMAYTAEDGACPKQGPGPWDGVHQRVRASGWTALPSNKAEPLMQALVQTGPVVVAVDGNNWFNYDSGVFDDCGKDAILGHAVLAKGYGSDNGKNYWLIQNSWGRDWGEAGHIRLVKHDDEDAWCGIDNKPKEGVGCDGGPAEITVCGTCGVLYDPIFPTNVRIEDVSADSSASSDVAAFSASSDVSATTAAPPAIVKFDAAKPVPPRDEEAAMRALLGKDA